jgi:hypothetical protein
MLTVIYIAIWKSSKNIICWRRIKIGKWWMFHRYIIHSIFHINIQDCFHILAYCKNPSMILAPISWIDTFLWMPLWPSKTKIIDSKFFNEKSKRVKSIHEQRELMLDSSNYNNKMNLSKSAYIWLWENRELIIQKS